MPNLGIYCCCGAVDPCNDCDPSGSGNDPEEANVTGMNGTDPGFDCTELNNNYTYTGFANTGTICTWSWIEEASEIPRPAFAFIRLNYAKANTSTSCGDSVSTGQWWIEYEFNPIVNLGIWAEITTGFSCDSSTGKVSGTHAFASANPDCDDGTDCQGPPTITVDP